jgi:hypothetical protein
MLVVSRKLAERSRRAACGALSGLGAQAYGDLTGRSARITETDRALSRAACRDLTGRCSRAY